LQHRGQEVGGIAVSDGETITVVKGHGSSSRRCSTSAGSRRSTGTCDRSVRLLDNGQLHVAQRASPVYRSVADAGFSLATTATSRTPSSWPRASASPGCAHLRQRAHR
jgi:glutamine phosphoribosylpyrophosphate amidotransferase